MTEKLQPKQTKEEELALQARIGRAEAIMASHSLAADVGEITELLRSADPWLAKRLGRHIVAAARLLDEFRSASTSTASTESVVIAAPSKRDIEPMPAKADDYADDWHDQVADDTEVTERVWGYLARRFEDVNQLVIPEGVENINRAIAKVIYTLGGEPRVYGNRSGYVANPVERIKDHLDEKSYQQIANSEKTQKSSIQNWFQRLHDVIDKIEIADRVRLFNEYLAEEAARLRGDTQSPDGTDVATERAVAPRTPVQEVVAPRVVTPKTTQAPTPEVSSADSEESPIMQPSTLAKGWADAIGDDTVSSSTLEQALDPRRMGLRPSEERTAAIDALGEYVKQQFGDSDKLESEFSDSEREIIYQLFGWPTPDRPQAAPQTAAAVVGFLGSQYLIRQANGPLGARKIMPHELGRNQVLETLTKLFRATNQPAEGPRPEA